MASNNNHWPQQQGWVSKGGGGRKRNPSNSPHQSEIHFNSRKRQDVIHKLKDMFIDIFDLEIIQSVAQNCGFNLHASIEALMMLSEDVHIHKKPVLQNASQLRNNAASAKPQISVPELPMQAKRRKEPRHASNIAPNSFVHISQAGRDRSSSPALGAIKITYKSPNTCEESDSDADVVIEEEKEYDVVGGCVTVNSEHEAFSMLQVPTSRHMTPIVPLSDGQGRGMSRPKHKKTEQMPSKAAAVTRLPNIKTSADLLSKKVLSAHIAQQKQVKPLTIPERVQKLIREGTRVMVLMRGAPGSGKTHLAKEIVRLTMGRNCDPSKYIFSTDDFFDRTKRFIPCLLPEAHNCNKERVHAAAERKLNPIIVDNTNTEIWEMKPYVEFAVRNGYVLELLEPSTPWRYQESELTCRNVHGVPRHQIQNMLARFEKNLTGKLLLAKLGLKYSPGNKPPQPAANAPPPQVKQKKKNKTKPQAVAVIPAETKPKKKRRKKSKSANQPSHEFQQPAHSDQAGSLMDTLALFLAKKALEEGQTLDPEVANIRLNSGVTVSDILLPNKGEVPQPASSCGAMKSWTTNDSVSSEGSVVDTCKLVNVNSQVQDDSSSGDDSNDDDDSDEEEEYDDDDDDADAENQMPELGGCHVSGEWLYQSDSDAQGDEEDLNGADSREPVSSEVQCWEYILVMEDSTWVYQKHHPETLDTGVQEDPESNTEQTEGLLIDLTADSDDITKSEISKVDFLVNAKQSVGTRTLTENLLIDILSNTEDNLENGVQELLSPVDAPIVADSSIKQTQSEASVLSQPFSLDDLDQWLCSLPVETGMDALHSLALYSETSATSPDMKPVQEPIEIKVAAVVPVTEDASIKTVELCPLGLEISPVLVHSNEENPMPENTEEGHVLETNIASGTRRETDTNALPAEDPENRPSLKKTDTELDPFPHTHQHISEPCPQTADRGSNEDEYHSAESSEEASSNGKKEVPAEEQKLEAKDLLILASGKAAPTYDLLSWVMKCKEEEAGDKEEAWEHENGCVNGKVVETNPDDVCGPREQRSPCRMVERNLKQSSNVEVQVTEAVPPELQAWETVPEPAKSWENKVTQQDGCKPSDGPQPQRSNFSSEESGQADQSRSRTCLVSSKISTLLTPDDFMQSSWENRLVTELQKIAVSDAGGHYSSMTDSTEVKAVTNTSTNTHYRDFNLVSQVNRPGDCTDPVEGIRIITCHNRSINEGTAPLKHFDRPVAFTLTLDKSSMTIEEDDITSATQVSAQEVNAQRNRDFNQLVAVFPNAPQDGLKEIFEKCCGDLNWTVDLLLELKLEQFTPLSPAQDTGGSVFKGLPLPVADVLNSEPSAPPLETQDVVPRCNLQVKKSWNTAPLSEQSQQLKRHLEECITLSDASYSEPTLRIRKLRHGELLDMGGVTAKPQQSPSSSRPFTGESTLGAIGSSGTRTPTPRPGDVADLRTNGVAVDEDTDSSSSTEEEETLPVALDPGFVSQLHQLFGNPSLPCPEDAEPVVNLPLSLAQQIHYYLVESQLSLLEQQQKQMEQMIQEDEELARQLQKEEQEGSTAVPDLQEIMDMEMALALYRTDQAQWRGKEMKDDLATKLSKQILCDMFPKLDKAVLLEVFVAHEKSLQKTVEAVRTSMGGTLEGVQIVTAPEACVAYERSLIEQAKEEQRKVDQEESAKAVVVRDPADSNCNMSPQEQAMEDANRYRVEASRHYQLHKECFRKAQDASKKRLTAVASYYSQVASLHKQRMDDANTRAAASLLSAHTLTQDNSTTLDMHYLHVAEALEALDLFLDYHIAKLAERQTAKQKLVLITGRGLHSLDGRPRIRPAVERRLKERGVKWVAENPGVLQVVVKRNFLLSHVVNTNS